MTRDNKKPHGGKREGAGRPSYPEPLIPHTVRLPQWAIDAFKRLGNGNLSAGVREVAKRLKSGRRE